MMTLDLAQGGASGGDFLARTRQSLQFIDLLFMQSKLCPFAENAGRFFVGGRNVYFNQSPGNGPNLGDGLEAWEGYFNAIHVAQNFRPLVNIDWVVSGFFKHQGGSHRHIVDYLAEMVGQNSADIQRNPNTPLTEMRNWDWSNRSPNIIKTLKGVKICYEYEKTTQPARVMKRVERFNNILPYTAARGTFAVPVGTCAAMGMAVGGQAQREWDEWLARQGGVVPRNTRDAPSLPVTFQEYFLRKNGITLNFPALPMVSVGPRQRDVKIPMEFCHVYHPQRFNKLLSPGQTDSMIKLACKAAPDRKRLIEEVARRANFENDPWLREFEMRVDLQMEKVAGRVLQPPAVVTHREARQTPSDGVWRWGRGAKAFKAASIRGYGFLLITVRGDPGIMEFTRKFPGEMRNMGIDINEQVVCVEEASNQGAIREKMAALASRVASVAGGSCDLFVCVLPTVSSPLYSEVKRVSEIEMGVMTQCILTKTIRKFLAQTAQNVAFKVNAKLGGVNWKIDPPMTPVRDLLSAGGTLVLGVDVTHPAPGDDRSPSIGCIVGNIDADCTRYQVSVKVSRQKREHIVYMKEAIRERVLNYYSRTSLRPGKIVVFRDGVSEGQYEQVLREEMRAIKRECAGLHADYEPKVTYVVVQKRHHTRLFCANEQHASGRARNVPPGTTVDTVVGHPLDFDYYQVTHQGIQGTCRPMKYTVIYDENEFGADMMQQLTHSLCYLYQRCTRGVKMPAPVYYAHLCCLRARCHLRQRLMETGSESDSGSGGRRGSESSGSSVRGKGGSSARSGKRAGARADSSQPDDDFSTADESLMKLCRVVDRIRDQGMYFM